MRAAELGLRVHLVSTDPAHSLGDVLGVALGDAGTDVAPGLVASEPDTRQRVEASWSSIQSTLRQLAARSGVGDIRAAEVSIVPGADELVALTVLAGLVDDPTLDLVVVDCAPTAETIRLLSAPQVLSWWIDRLAPITPMLANVLPLVEQFTGVSIDDAVESSSWRSLLATLETTAQVLTDTARTGVRLVALPHPVVVAETRRAASYVSLFGLRVDAVVMNRMLPDSVDDSFFDRWREIERTQLATLSADVAPAPVWPVDLAADEIVGIEALSVLGAAIYGDEDPTARFTTGPVTEWGHDDTGPWLDLVVGQVEIADVELSRRAGELHISIGPHRRAVALPDSLLASAVAGAELREDTLRIRFDAV